MVSKNNDIPLVITMNNAETALVNTVNELLSNLPCYLLEPLIDKIYRQIKEGAKKELVTAKNEYARKCAETDAKGGVDE